VVQKPCLTLILTAVPGLDGCAGPQELFVERMGDQTRLITIKIIEKLRVCACC